MEYRNITCEKCGATIKVLVNQEIAHCEYCGNTFYPNYSDNVLIEKEKTKQKLLETISQKEHLKNDDKPSEIINTCKIILIIEASFLLFFIFLFLLIDL